MQPAAEAINGPWRVFSSKNVLLPLCLSNLYDFRILELSSKCRSSLSFGLRGGQWTKVVFVALYYYVA